MEIRERAVDGVVVLDVSGPLLLSEHRNDALLRDRIAELITIGRRDVVINLANVSQVDTSGLTALVAAHLAAARRGVSVVLVNPTKRVRDLLGITRLNTVLDLCDDERAAIARIAAKSNLGT